MPADLIDAAPDGLMVLTNDAVTITAGADTWQEVALQYTYSADMWLMEEGALGRLRLNDVPANLRFAPDYYDLMVGLSVSSSCATQGRSWDFTVGENGVAIPEAELYHMGLDTDKSQTTDVRGTIALPTTKFSKMMNGDELSVMVRCSNNGTVIDLHNVILTVWGRPFWDFQPNPVERR